MNKRFDAPRNAGYMPDAEMEQNNLSLNPGTTSFANKINEVLSNQAVSRSQAFSGHFNRPSAVQHRPTNAFGMSGPSLGFGKRHFENFLGRNSSFGHSMNNREIEAPRKTTSIATRPSFFNGPCYNQKEKSTTSLESPTDVDSILDKPSENLRSQGPLPSSRTFKLMGQIVHMGGYNNISRDVYGNLMSKDQSFGTKDGPEMKSLANIITGHSELINQSSAQTSELASEKDLAESSAGTTSKRRRKSGSKSNVPANNGEAKSSRQEYLHNFPANVKILLSTGIFDGVPVQYVSWKRDKSLRAVIEQSGYKCSCKECNSNKIITGFEFERHAGYNTTHPNKNIYFANGKSLFVVVQELKSTPPEKLFEAVETITSSPVNQKNFCSWKESFIAANQEFQLIF